MIKILAIDDNNDNLVVLKALLSDAFPKATFIPALSGKRGIELCHSEMPDVILLDLVMPEMDGFEVCSRLKTDVLLNHIPVIMITAIKTSKENRIKALESGADAFLTKPIDEAELTAQIRAMLRIKESEDFKRYENISLTQLVSERTHKLEKELAERKRTEEELRLALKKLEMTKRASLNLMEDLKSEIETRKKTEEILRESEAKFAGIFNSAGDGIIYVTKKGTILDINPALSRITGLKREQLVGHNALQVMPKFLDLAILPAMLRQIQTVLSGKEIRPFEMEFRGRHLEIYASFKRDQENITVIIRDISEKKKTEIALHENQAQLDLALRSAQMGVWYWDITEDKRYFDEQVCHLLGINPENFKGTAEEFYNVLHPDDREKIKKALKRTIEQNVLYEPEYRTIWPDGSIHYLTARGRLVLDLGEKPLRINGIIWDVTSRKQTEEEILMLNTELEQRVVERTAQLEASMKELESFSYSVSHDLQTPLRAINGYSRILLEDYHQLLDDEGNRILNNVLSHTNRMGKLIDDLLTLVRVSRKEMQKHAIDMTDLAKSVFGELTIDGQHNHITLTVHHLPKATGDSTLMKQVWQNLLSNAIKYSSKSNNPVIEIGSSEGDKEILYFVRDNGVGFNPNYAHKLFGVFERLHKDAQYDGTGVGLAIVQRIIHKHKGRVWAEGEPGKGATFYFSLPKN
ncbi:MAG: PAS domain S-box protein [Bacteroidetes bacterium]|nr:PAS domain S-box protein [Bacteroidota bacterium]